MRPIFDSSQLRAVIFDFDGTLVSSPYTDFKIMHSRAREALLPFVHIPQALEGPILEDISRICAGMDAETAERARKAAMRAIEEVEVETALLSQVFPFVKDMVKYLEGRGIAVGIITRNCKAALYTAFPDVGAYFPCILTREDVEKVKPHPEHLFDALGILGVQAENALMIGDHPMDIITGKRAGAFTAGVTGDGAQALKLAEEEPDFLAEDAGEVIRMIYG